MKNKTVLFTLIGLLMLLTSLVAFYFLGMENFGQKPIYLYLLFSIAGAIIIIGIIFAILAAKGKIVQREPNYYAFFLIGIIWLPAGIVLENPGLWGMGLVFTIIGLINRKKWKDRPKWSQLSPAQKKFKLALIIILGFLVIAGFAAWFLAA